ncbi:MAG: phospholipase D-like domain-containing protein [Acidobacteriota bacterium]|nr:phospholipase D-like domain-containing protein [Acidobacteriota bacterium]
MKLVTQPDAGIVPVLEAIKKAKKTIDVVIFRFDLNPVEKALADAVQRGVMVRALIAHTNRGGESKLRKLEQRMLAAGLNVSRTADDLLRYHAKLMICDGMLHLLGFNFTKLDIGKSRSFAISTKDKKAVQEAAKVFEADLTRQPYVPAKSHLVVSPETSRAMLADFIKGARKELAIYDEKVNDPAMIKLLKERVAKGVRIRVLGSVKGKHDGIDEYKLAPMRLHVRAIVRDGLRAFVGSQSLAKGELEKRREVGLIVNNPTVARQLLQVFEADWKESAPKEIIDEKKEEKKEEKKDEKVSAA